MSYRYSCGFLCLLALSPVGIAQTQEGKPRSKGPFEFTRMIAHWAGYADEDYLQFVKEARPEVCQIGFYGGHFYALAHTPQYKGYPAHFPVQGLTECGQWHEKRTKAIQKLGATVVGHFNVTFLVGEPKGPKGPRGFFKFYNTLWDEKELGPKPVKDPLDLLAKHANGSPMSSKSYSIGGMREWTACLNNPHWQTVLKAWAKRGIARGVNGYQINYFYRHNCLCDHCRNGFRQYLSQRFTPAELKKKFQIAELKSHTFKEIVGWHNPKESTPLRREMLRWSQIACKRAFDNVFIRYARSLKPDLILSQWNHLGNFNQISGDERCLLPPNLWGRGEDYLWYSTGGAANFTDLANGILGEGTLQARYIRGAFEDKPFTLGKYEQTRIRAAIAELAANGGAPMGFYARHSDPQARREIIRYYRFIAKHDRLYRANRSSGEVLLLYPRSQVHDGEVEAIEQFRKLGRKLLDEHILFDVLPDDLLSDEHRKRYKVVLGVKKNQVLPKGLSHFIAPKTVRVSASQPQKGNGITLHFVNYNRTEPLKKRSPGRGIKDEKPTAVEGIKVDFQLPSGTVLESVSFATPESKEAVAIPFELKGNRAKLTLPKFLVYGIVHLTLKDRGGSK